MRDRAATALLVVATLLVVAGPAAAHNPADTVYQPTPFQGDLLVLGEEGTAARLTTDGTERWTANLSAQVVQPAVVAGDTAATVVRTVPEGAPQVQAFDGDGPAWNASLGGPGELGYVVPDDDGFLAVSSGGTMLELSADGDVRANTTLPIGARTAPVPAPSGGWVVADQRGRIAVVDSDGTARADTRLGGTPTDLARNGELVLAAFRRTEAATVKALDADLTTRWVVDRDALRIGGDLAVTDDAIYLGTYRPQGATVLALAPDGTELWSRQLEDETAAAVSVDGDDLYVTVNSGVRALSTNGSERWSAELSPRLVGPSVVGDLVVPSGADNRLVALHASNGTVAWTWSDGVTTVPWTDEQLASGGAGAGGADPGQDGQRAPLGPLVGALALLLGSVLWRRNRR